MPQILFLLFCFFGVSPSFRPLASIGGHHTYIPTPLPAFRSGFPLGQGHFRAYHPWFPLLSAFRPDSLLVGPDCLLLGFEMIRYCPFF